jgi:hypothetical protein
MEAQPRLLQPTRLLDFTQPAIEQLVERRGWQQLPTHERIDAVHDFVCNEIAFGYNTGDELAALRCWPTTSVSLTVRTTSTPATTRGPPGSSAGCTRTPSVTA